MEKLADDKTMQVMRLSALADAYGMLALLTQFPSEEVRTGLANGTLAEDALAILFEAGVPGGDRRVANLATVLEAASREAESDDALSLIRREYTRLFNRPDKPALCIYEELFLHVRKRRLVDPNYEREHDKEPRTFVNNASFDAERIYKKAGILRTKEISAPSDSMFVEMEFTQTLFTRLAKAALEEDAALRDETIEIFAEFKRLHLDKWMKLFYEDCAAESSLAFFGAMGCFGAIVYDLTCEAL